MQTVFVFAFAIVLGDIIVRRARQCQVALAACPCRRYATLTCFSDKAVDCLQLEFRQRQHLGHEFIAFRPFEAFAALRVIKHCHQAIPVRGRLCRV